MLPQYIAELVAAKQNMDDDDAILEPEAPVANGSIQNAPDSEPGPPTFKFKVFKSLLVGMIFLNMVRRLQDSKV